MVYIKNPAWLEDQDNRKAVYLVKEGNKIVGYFALQCGLLVKCNKKQISGIEAKPGSAAPDFFVNGNQIDVSKVVPAIELTHFCINDAYRMKRHSLIRCGVQEYYLGEYIFYRFIAEIVLDIANRAGMRVLYLYCADDPLKRLSNYYVNRLHFSKIEKMTCLRPEYDEKLECYTIDIEELRKNVGRFKDQCRIRVVINYIKQNGSISIAKARKECCIYDPQYLFEVMVNNNLARWGDPDEKRWISSIISSERS